MSKKWLAIAAVGYVASIGAAQACPSFANVGNESYEISGALPATTYPVVAGGDVSADFCQQISPVNASSVYGYFITPPDFSFFLSGAPGSTVIVSTNSPNPSCDTVLLTNTPTTDWYFNDDAAGLQSYIEMPDVPEGRLDVWVGTYSGELCQTNLVVEVVGGAAPADGGGGKPGEVVTETQPAPAPAPAPAAPATVAPAPAPAAPAPDAAADAVEVPLAPVVEGTEAPAAEGGSK